MIEDALLKWRFRQGSADALSRIYEKYVDFLLTLAMGLLYDKASAEDAVHDVFVSFAESVGNLKLRKSLKGYLSVNVRNKAYDQIRSQKRFAFRMNLQENCPGKESLDNSR